MERPISNSQGASLSSANEWQEWKKCITQIIETMKQTKEERKARAIERRKELSALSQDLKAVAQMEGVEESVNSLLLAYYKRQFSASDLRTFDQWKEAGYTVKKGQQSFMIWATPKATKAEKERVAEAKAKGEQVTEKEDYFPVCHLFDISQVHTITK